MMFLSMKHVHLHYGMRSRGAKARSTVAVVCKGDPTSPRSRDTPIPRASRSLKARYVDSKAPEAPSTHQEMDAQADATTFNWSKQWYPAAVVRELESKVPNAFELMGKDLVIWKDKQGTWR